MSPNWADQNVQKSFQIGTSMHFHLIFRRIQVIWVTKMILVKTERKSWMAKNGKWIYEIYSFPFKTTAFMHLATFCGLIALRKRD